MAALVPAFDAFAERHARGENQVVYARLAADLDTPVSLIDKCQCWLNSVRCWRAR